MSSSMRYRVHNDHQAAELAVVQTKDSYITQLTKNLRIVITALTDNDIEFDLIGVDTSIANALRRIMLAEVPTIAIEHVWIAVNNSVIQDEVLAHRIGLIPIKADPAKLDYVVGEEETDKDTLVFHFDVECTSEITTHKKHNGEFAYLNENALSGALTWLPQGNQEEVFTDPVAPVHDDIVLAKMKPGQRIEFEAHCRKGVGKDHTKYSPVSTASYRLMPEILFPTPITGDDAVALKEMCPMQVFDIEDLAVGQSTKKSGKPNSKSSDKVPTAVVARPRDCTMCRECIRREGWEEKVQLKRISDHFLFSVESTGCIPPERIVREAISVLKEKAQKFLSLVEDYENGGVEMDTLNFRRVATAAKCRWDSPEEKKEGEPSMKTFAR